MTRSALLMEHKNDRFSLRVLDQEDHRDDFKKAVSLGLAQKTKSIPPMFFYDEAGSVLFEEITEAEEYYPTRTEAKILSGNIKEILAHVGERFSLVELGSGSSTKTRVVLDGMAETQNSIEYTPIDISPTAIEENGVMLIEDYPTLWINALACDYHQALSELGQSHPQPRMFMFLGSSLGNFPPEEAVDLIVAVRKAMVPGDRFLLGLDMVKEADVLTAAYNDEKGATARFNLNLLVRINEELKGNFNLADFRHHAFFNEKEHRVEMHLESLKEQMVVIGELGQRFSFKKGETIHTEFSHKYTLPRLQEIVEKGGMILEKTWQDDKGWFSLAMLKV